MDRKKKKPRGTSGTIKTLNVSKPKHRLRTRTVVKVDSSVNYSRIGITAYIPPAKKVSSVTITYIRKNNSWEYILEPSEQYKKRIDELNIVALSRNKSSPEKIREDRENRAAVLIARIFRHLSINEQKRKK